MAALAEVGLADRVHVDSAGTGSWHIGEPPDPRMRAAARDAGLELEGQARQLQADDLEDVDLVLTMDRYNHADVLALVPDARDRVRLFRSYDPEADGAADVPDPYYGGAEQFAEVVTIAQRTAREVAAALRDELA